MSSSDRRTVDLRILSPALELSSSGLEINAVALDSTVGALKQQLTQLVPWHPSPDRQRLIWYGRLLADDSETLSHLFGDAVQNSPITLHLVVRMPTTPLSEVPPARPSQTAPAPPSQATWRAQTPPGMPHPPIPPMPQPAQRHVPFGMLPPDTHHTHHTPIAPLGRAQVPPDPHHTPLGRGMPPSQLLQQLMDRHQQEHRQAFQAAQQEHRTAFQHNRPHTHPPPQSPSLNSFPPPNPPASAPATPPTVQGQDGAHYTVHINHSTIAMPFPRGQMPAPNAIPGFPSIPNPLHQPQPLHQTQPFDATQPTLYLLSSPQGPHALLFSPQGTYTNNPQSQLPLFRQSPTPTQPPAPRPPHLQAAIPQPALAPPQQPAVQHVQQNNQQVAHQPLQQLNPDDNRQVDAIAPWQPILAQCWMLLRMMLFAWLFLGTGQGWRRPLVLLAIGIVFWFINSAALGDNVRNAVRSWWEGVVGLPPRNQAQAAADDTQAAQAAQPQNDQVQRTWLRQALRPVERALALFLASLWPGIGERTVAARREEENRLRREEEERRRLEDEERQRQLEADESARQENATRIQESAVALDEHGGAQATGADVTESSEAIRERKTAGSVGVEASTEGETAPSHSEQQTNTLAADW